MEPLNLDERQPWEVRVDRVAGRQCGLHAVLSLDGGRGRRKNWKTLPKSTQQSDQNVAAAGPGTEFQGRRVPESLSLVTKPTESWQPLHCHQPQLPLPQKQNKIKTKTAVPALFSLQEGASRCTDPGKAQVTRPVPLRSELGAAGPAPAHFPMAWPSPLKPTCTWILMLAFRVRAGPRNCLMFTSPRRGQAR